MKDKIIELSKISNESYFKCVELFPEYFITYDKNKIYAFRGVKNIYKLHRVGSGYAFISINDSIRYANGDFETAECALKENKNCIEFNDVSSFLDWCNKNK